MRFLFIIRMQVEAANAAAIAGKLGETIQSIVAGMKPESAYFTDSDGKRTAFIVVNMTDASQLPEMAEPWFLAFNAEIEVHVAMVAEDLAKAGPAIERAVKTYTK